MAATPKFDEAARVVLALGERIEPAQASKAVDPVRLAYAEKVDTGPNAGTWYVELNDGSTFRMPGDRTAAHAKAEWVIGRAYDKIES